MRWNFEHVTNFIKVGETKHEVKGYIAVVIQMMLPASATVQSQDVDFWLTDRVEAIVIIQTSVCRSAFRDNRELWRNGAEDRADFWHRPPSPQISK